MPPRHDNALQVVLRFPRHRLIQRALWTLADGGRLAEEAVCREPVSTPQFPGNSEKYREFYRKSAIKISPIRSYAENSKTWHSIP